MAEIGCRKSRKAHFRRDASGQQYQVLPLSPMDSRIRRAEYRAIFGFSSLYRYGMGTIPSIHIIVDNGHVTLVGIVENEADKNLAYIRANGVPGVFSVTNDLQVANEHS